MKTKSFSLVRYDADEGFVFDWAEPHFEGKVDEEGNPTGEETQIHLYAKTLFIGGNDSIENYVEVENNVLRE